MFEISYSIRELEFDPSQREIYRILVVVNSSIHENLIYHARSSLARETTSSPPEDDPFDDDDDTSEKPLACARPGAKQRIALSKY